MVVCSRAAYEHVCLSNIHYGPRQLNLLSKTNYCKSICCSQPEIKLLLTSTCSKLLSMNCKSYIFTSVVHR